MDAHAGHVIERLSHSGGTGTDRGAANPELVGPLLPLQDEKREVMETVAQIFHQQTERPNT